MPPSSQPERSSPRAWSGPLAGVLALVLLVGVFPNPLRQPPENPSALAEYAPISRPDVPPAPEANFSETDLASSDGIGTGLGALPAAPRRGTRQYLPSTHECVGDPPRQTEDPLSPPCVGVFYGANGGATSRGVTRDEIRVLLYNDWGLEGELSGPYDPTEEPDHSNSSIRFSPEALVVRTIKAHLRFFQRRFQTYGRRVRVFAKRSQGVGTSCEQRRGDAMLGDTAANEAFAALDFSFSNATCFVDHIARVRKVMTFGVNWHLPPEVYTRNAPLVYGFYPDQGIEAAWSASFICRALAHRRATLAGDPALRSSIRRFGLIHGEPRKYTYYEDRLAERLIDNVERGCGLRFDQIVVYEEGSSSEGGIMRRFAEDGITTVVCHCTASRIAEHQRTATLDLYHPEWFFDHGSGVLFASAARQAIQAGQPSFGITHFWELPRIEQQFHYLAYRREEPTVGPNLEINFHVYMQLLNLFTGIQAAGPRLTPRSVQRGMSTFRHIDQLDATQPTGGYGAYGPKAVGTFTFIDTAALWWWDPSGREPGRGDDGCIRLAERGRRFYAQELPAAPRLFDASSAACTADPQLVSQRGFP